MYVIRLWCFCQERKTDLLPRDTAVLAEVCQFRGVAERLMTAMLTCRFLDEVDEGIVRVHGWNDRNCGLLTARVNGKKGGAHRHRKPNPPDNPPDNPPGEPRGVPRENPRDNDKIRLDKTLPTLSRGAETETQNGPIQEELEALRDQPELRGLSLEQWVRIRAMHPKALERIGWVEKVKGEAAVFGNMNSVGPWLLKRLSRMETETPAAVGDGEAERPVYVPLGERNE